MTSSDFTPYKMAGVPASVEYVDLKIAQLEVALSEVQQLATSLLEIVLYNGLIMPPSDDSDTED